MRSSLETIQDGAVNGGATADDCPGVDDLNSGLTSLSTAQLNLARVLQATANCSFIDTSGSSLNSVEERLNVHKQWGSRLLRKSGLWKFCSLSSIATILRPKSGLRCKQRCGDGQVSSCEMVQHCLGSACF